jgi:hypothetical protein
LAAVLAASAAGRGQPSARAKGAQVVSLQEEDLAVSSVFEPFPKGDYQAAVDFLPITTFFDLSVEKPWLPKPITHRLPALLQKFDLRFGLEENLQGWDPVDSSGGDDPRTVLCCGTAVGEFLDWAKEHLDSSHNDRTVVFSGTETPLSENWGNDEEERAEVVRQYQVYFKRIFYYVTDVPLEGVDTMPLGFTEMYMRGRTDQFLEAYGATSIDDSWKTHTILAAWGTYTKVEGKHYVYGHHPFADNYGTDSWAWTEVANHAIDMRNDAIGWIGTPEGQLAGVERRTIKQEDWWMELSRYKFLVSPLGTGIQCSKVPESLSMLTIPIVKRGPFRTHDDLIRLGFPIVVVEYWAEITHETMDMWWKELSPKLLDFRSRCLTTEGYWRLFTQGHC